MITVKDEKPIHTVILANISDTISLDLENEIVNHYFFVYKKQTYKHFKKTHTSIKNVKSEESSILMGCIRYGVIIMTLYIPKCYDAMYNCVLFCAKVPFFRLRRRLTILTNFIKAS